VRTAVKFAVIQFSKLMAEKFADVPDDEGDEGVDDSPNVQRQISVGIASLASAMQG
jgi:hypothetical protein